MSSSSERTSRMTFTSETAKLAASFKPRKPKSKRLYKYQHIADAAGISVRKLQNDIKNKEFNPHSLKSIAYYIVKKTMKISME
jgi:hypothetical protein